LALNSPTQGSGIIILKEAMNNFFRWIVKEGLFGKVLICDLVHDEAVIEYPETMPEVSEILKKFMEEASAKFCKKLPIPAVPEVGDHWIH
jgi:DNA polymerase I-like protein with 3'-5' exonuclease and polymerase domains